MKWPSFDQTLFGMYAAKGTSFRTPMIQREYLFSSPSIISSLHRDYLLEGHEGCVNTVNFSEFGDLLLSGSDDMHLNIYDTNDSFKLRLRMRTGHEHNIFRAKFMYLCNSSKIVSTACDHSLFFTEINFREEGPNNRFNCHTSIPFEVSVLEREPYVFLVCSTEGAVRQYDIREKTSCRCNHCQRDVVIHVPTQIHSMDVCPTRPYECILGLSDNCIQFYDRRKTFTVARSHDCGRNAAMFQLETRKTSGNTLASGFTSVRYSPDGTEFLCNFVGDRVTVFSCDFSDRMEQGQPYLSRPECYARSSYFDACAAGVKHSFSERDRRDSGGLLDTCSNFGSDGHEEGVSLGAGFEIEPTTSVETIEVADWLPYHLGLSRALNGGVKMPAFIPLTTKNYTGHSNVRTMLKEAIFWGKRFIMAGSDCGHVFIWDRKTDKVVKLLTGDRHIVNSLAHHPVDPILACSGIDSTVKIFRPREYAPMTEDELSRVLTQNRFLLQEHRDLDISTGESDPDSDREVPQSANSHVFSVFLAPGF